jgi:hypothetical protein
MPVHVKKKKRPYGPSGNRNILQPKAKAKKKAKKK